MTVSSRWPAAGGHVASLQSHLRVAHRPAGNLVGLLKAGSGKAHVDRPRHAVLWVEVPGIITRRPGVFWSSTTSVGSCVFGSISSSPRKPLWRPPRDEGRARTGATSGGYAVAVRGGSSAASGTG